MTGKLTRGRKRIQMLPHMVWQLMVAMLHLNGQLQTETHKDVKNLLYCRGLLNWTDEHHVLISVTNRIFVGTVQKKLLCHFNFWDLFSFSLFYSFLAIPLRNDWRIYCIQYEIYLAANLNCVAAVPNKITMHQLSTFHMHFYSKVRSIWARKSHITRPIVIVGEFTWCALNSSHRQTLKSLLMSIMSWSQTAP